MRKMTVWMQMSLDGYAGAPGPFDWPVVTDDLTDFWLEIQSEIDTFIYGRKIFEFMSRFWPTADASPEAGAYQKAYAPVWRETAKYVISRTLQTTDWKTTVIGDGIAGRLNELKQQEGKTIAVFGGPETASSLIAMGLIDEYRLFIHPVVLGGGQPVFPGSTDRSKLSLLDARSFSGGTIATHYRSA